MNTNIVPARQDWETMKEQCAIAVKSGFLPNSIKTPEQAMTIAMKGRELGVPPMQAFSHIHVIQGKPSPSSELQLSLVYKNCPGAVINYLESNEKICRIQAIRPGHKPSEFQYSIEDAKRAKLLHKDSWVNYPAAMLRARAVAIVARAVFPDAIVGASYIAEELGAEVNEEGEVIVPSVQIESKPESQRTIKEEAPKASDEPTRLELGKDINALAKEMKVSKAELAEWIKDHCGKSAKDMTIENMKSFLEMLYEERARIGLGNAG